MITVPCASVNRRVEEEFGVAQGGGGQGGGCIIPTVSLLGLIDH